MQNKENSDNGSSVKYKFYRKPSFKKKGPEVRQTKTSAARMLKANPLLKLDDIKKPDKPKDIVRKPNVVNLPKEATAAKVTIIKSNGPLINRSVKSVTYSRLSSSEFKETILSSTLKSDDEDDNVFIPPTCIPNRKPKTKMELQNKQKNNKPKTKMELPNKQNNNLQNVPKLDNKPLRRSISSHSMHNVPKLDNKPLRRSISARYKENKKKELVELSKPPKVSTNNRKLRRSRSLDDFRKAGKYVLIKPRRKPTTAAETDNCSVIDRCSIILEESVKEAESLQNLSELEKNNTFRNNFKTTHAVDPYEDYDDENKENIDLELPDSTSYDNLLIGL